MKKIAFRVDGGPTIGMGHIMRSIALAQAFPNDVKLMFITKENESVKKVLNNYDFEIIYISNNLNYGKEEIKKAKKIISKKDIDILVTDSYNIEQKYLNQIKNKVDELVTIHDFAPYAFPSDIVINGNIYAPELDYKSLYDDTKFLLGTDYTLLREEFNNLPQIEIKKEMKNILITVGGSDLLNLTPKIIKAFQLLEKSIDDLKNINKDNVIINIVIGSGFDNIEEIIKEVRKSNFEISLSFNVKKMSKLMINSDMAISAGGSTLYELAITGTPTISLIQANNQLLVAKDMAEKGIIKNLGYWDFNLQELKNEITEIIQNYEKRKDMFLTGKNKIKNGVSNVVESILD